MVRLKKIERWCWLYGRQVGRRILLFISELSDWCGCRFRQNSPSRIISWIFVCLDDYASSAPWENLLRQVQMPGIFRGCWKIPKWLLIGARAIRYRRKCHVATIHIRFAYSRSVTVLATVVLDLVSGGLVANRNTQRGNHPTRKQIISGKTTKISRCWNSIQYWD